MSQIFQTQIRIDLLEVVTMIPPVYTKIACAYGDFAIRQIPKVAKWGLPAAVFGK